jgi:Holliday junction resolvase RusA-like endonuclease
MPRFTIDQLRQKGYEIKGGEIVRVGDSWNRNSVHEKQPNVFKKQKHKHSETAKTKSNERDYTSNAIVIKAEIADNRRRDLDGMLNTILDCLVRAGIIEDDSISHIDTMVIFAKKSDQFNTKVKITSSPHVKQIIQNIFENL